MSWSDVVSIVGALGVGSFIGQYLIGSQQRRQVRSDVLKHLSDAETARWAGGTTPAPNFTESMRELETAALIARVPRRVIAHYKVFAYCARWLSQASWDDDPDPEYGGGINGEFADLVRAAAGEVSRVTWAPWWGRVGMKRRLAKRRTEAGHIERIESTLARAEKYLADY
ncbi:hypothetical protein [Nocardioides sp. SLBN-35]|uniref:hypothetical protein n=1 Tax=Nocardioides sp. SLBN-35 TaxID=2768445 RepID=UPI001152F941|nr:hypothetical protein [Nocardioides sp. SLBN-35]